MDNLKLSDFKEGQSVTYCPGHGKKEKGVVKRVSETTVFVVYNCAGEWHNYQNYTAASTNPRDLVIGWVD